MCDVTHGQFECLYFLFLYSFYVLRSGWGGGRWGRDFFNIFAQSFCSDWIFHFSVYNFSSKFLSFPILYGHRFFKCLFSVLLYIWWFFPQLFVFCLFMGFGVSCVVDEVTIERRTHALSHLFKLSLVSVGVSTGSIIVGILVLVYASGASFPIITGAPVWSGTVVMLFSTL